MRTFLAGETLGEEEVVQFDDGKCPDCGTELVAAEPPSSHKCPNAVCCGAEFVDQGSSTVVRTRDAGPGSHP